MRESKFVKTKIVAGYLVLLAVLFFSVSYVYRTVVRVSAEDDAYAQLQLRHNLVSQTLYRLYQAESYGQLMLAGYQSYERLYRRELNTVRACLDSLRRLGGQDSLRTDRLDSIARLVDDKERRTTRLRRSIRSGGTAGLLDKNIEELIRFADTLPALDAPAPPAAETVVQDTMRIPKRKRRFFRRVADLFSPPKEDSSVVISRRIVVDTLPDAADLRDTITTVLRSLQDRVTGERIEIYEKAWNEGQRLRYSNDLVNAQIYRLITDFEQEESAYLLRRVEEAAALRRRSSQVLGAMTIGAVVLMLLFVAVLWRDVSRSNRYKRRLEQANREKQALLDAREQMMLAITHDIKAPLGTIMGYLDLLARLGGSRREALYLERMRGASEHLLALVNSLLDFYRLDIRKVDLNRVAFSPAQLFSEIGSGFAPAAEAKGLTLQTKIAPEAVRPVVGDAFRIRQIADNLLSNALKFTDKGSVMLRVDRVPGRLVFRVEDTGRGIGREERERIFREFVRLQLAQGVDGFGLGLSIVDRLVKLLGGTIALESSPGRGTTFIVSLPVGEAPELPQEAGQAGSGEPALPDTGEGNMGPDGAEASASGADGSAGAGPAAEQVAESPAEKLAAPLSAAKVSAGPDEPDVSSSSDAGRAGAGPAAEQVAESFAGELAAPSASGKPVAESIARQPAAESPAGQPAAVPGTREPFCTGIRLLLVDDDPLQLEMTAAMCRAAGIAAACCPDPRLAARLAAEHPFDAVLTDIQMPGTDGFAVLAEIRECKPGLPVIAVTARSERNSADFAACGFAGHLHKPFSVRELTQAVCAVCGRRSAGRTENPSANPINAAPVSSVSESAPAAPDFAPAVPHSAPGSPRFEALTAFAGDDARAAREILRSFVEQNTANCRLLREAAAAGDAAAIRAVAHKMVPIFTMLAQTALAENLRKLENAPEKTGDEMRRKVGEVAEKVMHIVLEAQKKLTLP